ncbi:MAG: DUF1844 domain-containing protein [Acidimicrobiales bacterium]
MSSIWTPGGEVPVDRGDKSGGQAPPRSNPPPTGGPGDAGELSPEQHAQMEDEFAAMQQELVNTPASVVIANHAIGLFQLAALHLSVQPPNLEQGQLAIDALGALVEGLAGRLDENEASLVEALGQLRMAFVQLKSAGDAPIA